MHQMGLWWRQPDHYDWLSDYLAARGLKPFVRYLLAAILTNLAAATLLMLFSSSGPQTPMRRAVAVAFVVSLAAMALVWLLRWPTRFQSQMFSITGALGIAAICVIESDPRSGMLGCAAFGGLAGYVAFFHSARLLVFTLGSALAPIHRSAVGAALNSIVCLDCGVRGGVRVGDRPASLSGCSCGSSRRGMGEKIWLGGDGLFPVKQVVEQGVPRVFPGPVLG